MDGIKSKLLVLQRIEQSDAGTIGRMEIDGEFVCYSNELPWLDNERNVSCIPAGRYDLKWKTSPRFGLRLHVEDVAGRSHILIHPGNRQHETEGCIMPATYVGRDAGGCCGRQSRIATDALQRLLPQGVTHQISVRDGIDYAG